MYDQLFQIHPSVYRQFILLNPPNSPSIAIQPCILKPILHCHSTQSINHCSYWIKCARLSINPLLAATKMASRKTRYNSMARCLGMWSQLDEPKLVNSTPITYSQIMTKDNGTTSSTLSEKWGNCGVSGRRYPCHNHHNQQATHHTTHQVRKSRGDQWEHRLMTRENIKHKRVSVQ